ncbi:MAG: type IV pilin N-terminal domain-containing protein [Methanospirillum sp.]|uniref:type IV pilin N-terminal domain-containing protein n=1 Tax=Methanospirillum sp. TaxID=45200 RepID=UPI00236E3A63|nr:type IV pilin N-terminal domain-containing protein [Methanospirillum sp.]MDD1728587.1 type IV pilin N-terminal domain-containing protein [Methanospirillum sp.]
MRTESAVSPVIGVLLMLTLTLIIAAIVNSYAGGLIETKDKPPSVTLQGEFHQSQSNQSNASLTITHISGDPLPVSEVSIILKPTKTFGPDADNKFVEINKKFITNKTGNSGNDNWAAGITSMKAGETQGIFGEDIKQVYNSTNGGYDLFDQKNLGNTFYLEFYYDRNLIAKPEILIQS